MSLQALHTSATGMEAFQFKLDNIANNLANAGTTGFKRQRVNFEDLYYQQFKPPGAPDNLGQLTPTGIALGLGTRVESTAETVCVSVFDVAPELFASPPYTAVIAWLPSPSVETLRVASPPTIGTAPPRSAAPSLNCTVPLGSLPTTIAWKVTSLRSAELVGPMISTFEAAVMTSCRMGISADALAFWLSP